ncbi:MAG TPA: hypothetical protein VGD98_14795 [Ktedonobacteraceae bacterium]
MLSSDEMGYDSSESIMRASRAASRREILKSKRTRNTEMLPSINDEDAYGKSPRSQVTHQREENLRLRHELEELQGQLSEYQDSINVLDEEIETIHRDHRQEIEQHQQHLREMLEERNQMQEVNQHWEQRYQELYHAFQDAVEEEANKLVQEAAQTLILAPEHTPALLSDVVKTLETQMKQTEDQRTAELLAIMRQAQYKSELLEQEVARERNELASEREHLLLLRGSISQQAQQRYQVESARLRARWTLGLTFTSILMLCVLATLETVFISFGLPLMLDIFGALAICMVLTYIVANLYTSGRINIQAKAKATGGAAGASKKVPAKASARRAQAKR